MVCHHCGVKGHGVNECPKLTHAQGKQFWEDCNEARHEKTNSSPKKFTANAAVAEVVSVVPAEDDAASIKYKRYQRLMSVMEELDIGMVQVGHSDTGVVEDMNAVVNILSQETSNSGKRVSWDKSIKSVNKRFTLDAHKLYLDSCATYHSSFVMYMLGNVHQASTVLQGNCNSVISTSDEKGFFGLWDFWLNEQGIANLLSIPQLEKYGYVINYTTNRDWVVTTPERKTVMFQKDVDMCKGMPYLDVRGNHDAFVMIQTFREKFGMFTEKQVEKAIESREMQAHMDHTTDEMFKPMVSSKSLDDCSVVASDVTNARILFGPNCPGLRGKIV